MSELITKQAMKDMITNHWSDFSNEANYRTALACVDAVPPIQPTDKLQKLADEIASFKRCVKSDNSDYLTGYLCALSAVEGMIADMRGEQDG